MYFCLFVRNDGSEFNGSVFQRVNNELETGVQLKWAAGSNATSFGIAAKYCPDKDTTYRVSTKQSPPSDATLYSGIPVNNS